MKSKEKNDLIQNLNVIDFLDKDFSYIKDIFKDFDVEEKDMRICKYLNLYNEGISFCMKNEKVDFVYIYNKNIMKFSVKWEMVNKNIVEIFGDTPKKQGGNCPVWLNYENLGIEFNFLNSSWSDTSNPIIFICIFKPNETKLKCNMCLKEIIEIFPCANKCGKVFYCSTRCFNIHNKIHLIYCN